MNIQLDLILYLAGAITGIAAASRLIIKMIKNAIMSVSTTLIQQTTAGLECELLKKIVEVNTSLTHLIEENRKKDEKTRELSVATAASAIFEAHSLYMERGSITTFALANLEALYRKYVAERGNSYGEICMNQIRMLPILDRPHEVLVNQLGEHKH